MNCPRLQGSQWQSRELYPGLKGKYPYHAHYLLSHCSLQGSPLSELEGWRQKHFTVESFQLRGLGYMPPPFPSLAKSWELDLLCKSSSLLRMHREMSKAHFSPWIVWAFSLLFANSLQLFDCWIITWYRLSWGNSLISLFSMLEKNKINTRKQQLCRYWLQLW